MAVTVSKNQLEKMIELAYVGYYLMIDSAEDESEISEYTEAFQSFYTSIKPNLDREVVGEDENSEIFFNGNGSSKRYIKDVIKKYDEQRFVEQLPYHLAKKDALIEFSKKSNYSLADFYQRIKILEEAYADEFEENGLERLGIVEQFELEEEESFVLDHQIYV